MTNDQLLVTVILLQQAFFCTLWLVAVRLRIARRPARHWAAAAALIGASMGVLLLRHMASPGVIAALVNLCFLASFVVLRRGAQSFARLTHADREQLIVLALGLAVAAGATLWGRDKLPLVMGVSVLIGWTLLRSTAEVSRALVTEFGPRVALWLSLPTLAIGLLFLLRAALAFLVGDKPPAAPGTQVPVNAGMLFVAMVLGVLINATLAAMVVGRLVLRLQFQSEHDSLTGLLGRRPMDLLLHAEARRQDRSGLPYALLSIDIDHFKEFNDRCGHAVGDAVLVRVAQALRSAAREVDAVARMGGEEFFVLLPGTDLAGARQAAQRMLDVVRGLHCTAAGERLPVTISIGVAVATDGGESVQALLQRVDQALYVAKAAGRDRIEIAPAPAPA